MSCPCGGGPDLALCCGPYLSGAKWPETAEILMRSRYTAFTQGKVGYIFSTHDPSTIQDVDQDFTKTWAKESTWKGLEILATSKGGPDDNQGTVEFITRFDYEKEPQEHHEVSQFRKNQDGHWLYRDGKMQKGQPVRRDSAKVGRNRSLPLRQR